MYKEFKGKGYRDVAMRRNCDFSQADTWKVKRKKTKNREWPLDTYTLKKPHRREKREREREREREEERERGGTVNTTRKSLQFEH